MARSAASSRSLDDVLGWRATSAVQVSYKATAAAWRVASCCAVPMHAMLSLAFGEPCARRKYGAAKAAAVEARKRRRLNDWFMRGELERIGDVDYSGQPQAKNGASREISPQFGTPCCPAHATPSPLVCG